MTGERRGLEREIHAVQHPERGPRVVDARQVEEAGDHRALPSYSSNCDRTSAFVT